MQMQGQNARAGQGGGGGKHLLFFFLLLCQYNLLDSETSIIIDFGVTSCCFDRHFVDSRWFILVIDTPSLTEATVSIGGQLPFQGPCSIMAEHFLRFSGRAMRDEHAWLASISFPVSGVHPGAWSWGLSPYKTVGLYWISVRVCGYAGDRTVLFRSRRQWSVRVFATPFFAPRDRLWRCSRSG